MLFGALFAHAQGPLEEIDQRPRALLVRRFFRYVEPSEADDRIGFVTLAIGERNAKIRGDGFFGGVVSSRNTCLGGSNEFSRTILNVAHA